jgi:putative flippase GtrA
MRPGQLERDFTQPQPLTRTQEVVKFFRFVGFEISAGVVQIVVFTILHEGFGCVRWAASYLPALIASVLWSFTANQKFTFKSVSNIPIAMCKVTLYYVIFTPASTWWGDALNQTAWGINATAQDYIVLGGTMIVNFATEFMVYRFWVYRKSINTSDSGVREQEHYQVRYGG